MNRKNGKLHKAAVAFFTVIIQAWMMGCTSTANVSTSVPALPMVNSFDKEPILPMFSSYNSYNNGAVEFARLVSVQDLPKTSYIPRLDISTGRALIVTENQPQVHLLSIPIGDDAPISMIASATLEGRGWSSFSFKPSYMRNIAGYSQDNVVVAFPGLDGISVVSFNSTTGDNNSVLIDIYASASYYKTTVASGDGSIIAVVPAFPENNFAQVLDYLKQELLFTVDELSDIKSISLSERGDMLKIVGKNKISTWDVNSGVEINRFDIRYSSAMYGASCYYCTILSPSNYSTNSYAIGRDEIGQAMRIYEITLPPTPPRRLRMNLEYGTLTAVSIDSMSRYLCFGDNNGYLYIYDRTEDRLVDHFRAFYDNDYEIISCDGVNRKIHLWYNSKFWVFDFSVSGDFVNRNFATPQNATEKVVQDNITALRNKYRSNLDAKQHLISVQTIRSNLAPLEQEQFVSALQASVVNFHDFRVVEKDDLDYVVNELKAYLSGLYAESTHLEVGQFLAADFILLATSNRAAGELYVTAKLIRIETGEVLSVETGRYSSFNQLLEGIPKMSRRLLSSVISVISVETHALVFDAKSLRCYAQNEIAC